MSITRAPECKWAQRKDTIMLTIIISEVDPAKAKIEIKDTSFSFESPISGGGTWSLKFDFFGEVDASNSKWNVTSRAVAFIIPRKSAGAYWDKLNKGAKLTTLKCDWDKWKDEDETKEGFDTTEFGNFGGILGGGTEGPDSDDDDDEEPIAAPASAK